MKGNLLIPILACAPFAHANNVSITGNLPDAVIGSSYGAVQLGPGSFHKNNDPQLLASGGQAPYHFVLAGGSLPSGISLNSDGTITGVTFSPGTFNFAVDALDSLDNRGTASFQIVVDPQFADPPVNGTAGSTFFNNPTCTLDSGGGAFSYNVGGSLPPGVTFDSTTSIYSGIPTKAGTYANSWQCTGIFTFTITKTFVIAAQPSVNLSATAGVPFSYVPQINGGTKPFVFSISAGTLPPGFSFDTVQGTFSGIPLTTGAFTFDQRLVDAAQRALTITYTIVVAAAPVKASFSTITFTGITDGAPVTTVATIGAGIIGQAFTSSASTTDGRGWLRTSGTSRSTPGTVNITADPTGLPAATYQGTVTINVPNGNPTAVTIAVTFVVQAAAPPQLRVDPTGVTFALVQGSLPAVQAIQVSNTGSGSVAVSVTAATVSGGKWLSVAPSSGTVTASSPLTLIVAASPTGLPTGTYSGTITIVSGSATIVVPVTLAISNTSSKLSLSQSGFTFTGVAGQPAGPPARLTVSNAGNGSLGFTAAASTISGGTWLSVSPAASSATAAGTDLQIVADPSKLTVGDYYGLVTITAPGAGNTPQSVVVILHVTGTGPGSGAPSGANFSPASLVFLAPGSQVVSVSTAGSVLLQAAVTDDYGTSGAFFTHSLSSVSFSAGKPATITVKVDTSARKAGIYRGDLVVLTSDGVVQRIPVILVVPASAGSTSDVRDAAACTPTQLVVAPTTLSPNFNVAAAWPTPIEAIVVDDCASFSSTGSVVTSFSNGDLPISLSQQGDGRWSGTWAGVNPVANVVLTVTARTTDLQLTGTALLSGALAANPAPPLISDGGIVNGASFALQAPLAPGSFVSLFGTKLAQGQLKAPTVPLPTTLSGATIVIAGVTAPIFFTSDGQLNAIIPYGIPVNTTQQVIAQRETSISVPQKVGFAAAAPGIFSYGVNPDGTPKGLGIIVGVDPVTGAQPLADSTHPVTAGQTVVIYCTGLGEVNPPVPAGNPTPLSPLTNTVNTVTATIGGVPAQVGFAGLTPGSTGLYQVNAVVPSGVTPGDSVLVVLTAAGQSSVPVKISVK